MRYRDQTDPKDRENGLINTVPNEQSRSHQEKPHDAQNHRGHQAVPEKSQAKRDQPDEDRQTQTDLVNFRG